MKIATIIIRVLLGALMLFASLSYFFKFFEEPQLEGNMLTFMTGVMATNYLMPLVKGIELLAAISLLSGKYLKLFLVVLMPITLNIFLLHLFVSKSDLPIGIFVLAANIFLMYRNWDSYKGLLSA